MSYLIGTAVCGWVIVILYPRLVNELGKQNRNLALVVGQTIFLLAVVGLGLAGILLWWDTRVL